MAKKTRFFFLGRPVWPQQTGSQPVGASQRRYVHCRACSTLGYSAVGRCNESVGTSYGSLVGLVGRDISEGRNLGLARGAAGRAA